MQVLLTGANGFIGSAIARSLIDKGYDLKVIVRNKSCRFDEKVEQHLCDLSNVKNLSLEVFANVDCVIHSAAQAHVKQNNFIVSQSKYRINDCDITLNLAKLASAYGVKRFVFLSSIKVHGEHTEPNTAFKPEDDPSTNDAYGLSKLEAERQLLRLAHESDMEVVIIRPPLVYGPGVKANFALMVRWISKGFPLPLGVVDNKRSLIALDNLVDFILLCTDRTRSPNATNQIFLISDTEDVSTSTLLQRIAKAYGTKFRLFPVPIMLIRLFAKLLGKSDVADRLFGNLQVDSSKARELLGWYPVVTMDEQLKKMAELEKTAEKL